MARSQPDSISFPLNPEQLLNYLQRTYGGRGQFTVFSLTIRLRKESGNFRVRPAEVALTLEPLIRKGAVEIADQSTLKMRLKPS